MEVADKKIRSLQREGMNTKSHNFLLNEDIDTIFQSPSLSKNTPKGYQTRLVVTVGILIGMRPTGFSPLLVSQFERVKLRDSVVWKINASVGARNGSSKKRRMELCGSETAGNMCLG